MNKLNYLIGLACLGTVFACSDNLPLDNSVTELPSLPTDIITGDRLMGSAMILLLTKMPTQRPVYMVL